MLLKPKQILTLSFFIFTVIDFLASILLNTCSSLWIFTSGSDVKESACNAANLDLIPGSERYPEEGNGYTLQYSCLETSMGKSSMGLPEEPHRPWGRKELDTTEQLTPRHPFLQHEITPDCNPLRLWPSLPPCPSFACQQLAEEGGDTKTLSITP